MTNILHVVNRFIWGSPALLLILLTGIVLSFGSRFAQLRLLPAAIRSLVSKIRRDESQNGISSFQALCTALAATVGTGNIAGVAGAIALGGPGAVFWMWISGILGMIVKCAEATLAVRFRSRSADDICCGGPMHVICCGMGRRYSWLASVYAFMGVFAAFGVGNATQINAVLSGVGVQGGGDASKLISWGIALGIAAIVFAALYGGAKRIGQISSYLVPFAAVAYIFLCLGVLFARAGQVPGVFQKIVCGAFTPSAVTGGAIGSAFTALRTGISRGVFTNEAGMGTAAIAHASAEVAHPMQQGLMGIIEVFLDTIVICTLTALVILTSGVEVMFGVDEGALLTFRAFAQIYGNWVSVPLTTCLCLFAVATMLGWGFYALQCAKFLFGERSVFPVLCVQFLVTVISAMLDTSTVWVFAEIVNGLMAIPNLIALLTLTPTFLVLVKEYKYT